MKKDRYYYDTLMDKLYEIYKHGYISENDKEAPNKTSLSNAQTVLHAGLTENFLPDNISPSHESGIGLTYVLEESILFIDCLNSGEIMFHLDYNNGESKSWSVKRGIGSIKNNLKFVRENGSTIIS